MSTHEQRLAALQTEIQTFETENIAPKEWTLLGEASARSRPHDALLGQDLEFERTSRNVPIITDTVVAALEERIKARIKEGRFDDVVRRRPAIDGAVPFLPSRLIELQDTKSTQSLAQIYEGEYVAAQSGTPVDDRDGRLQREHDEITRVWEGICAKLDALCNAHYVPKPVRRFLTLDAERALMACGTAESEYHDGVERPGCIPRIGAAFWQIHRQYACSRRNTGSYILLRCSCTQRTDASGKTRTTDKREKSEKEDARCTRQASQKSKIEQGQRKAGKGGCAQEPRQVWKGRHRRRQGR